MKKNTYIISDYSETNKKITEDLNLPDSNIIPFEIKDSEENYHNWLHGLFEEKNIEQIIIPISLSTDETINSIGLELGLHIRLNYELSIHKRTIPIIFISFLTIEHILKNNTLDKDTNPQLLLFGKGSYLSTFDTDKINQTLKNSSSLSESEYKNELLPLLSIQRKATSGGHDIANAWGAFKFAQVLKIEKDTFKEYSISNHLKQLYAKYLICKNDLNDEENLLTTRPIHIEDKRILFIDDKANEGWGEIMSKVFASPKTEFTYIDPTPYKTKNGHKSFTNFEGFYMECLAQKEKEWDLILIDLRLNPEKEDDDNRQLSPEDFSGYKLINEFLNTNEGNQIIVFTASNKIWNLNAAIKRGARGFYIKESPDFNYSYYQSIELYNSFKENIKECFNRSHLRSIFSKTKDTKKTAENSENNFIAESNVSIDTAWELIKNDHLDFGYLILFQILEQYAKSNFVDDKISNCSYINETCVIEPLKDSTEERTWKLTFVKDKEYPHFKTQASTQKISQSPTTLFIVSCFLHFILKKDGEFLEKFGTLNKLRNDIAHNKAKNISTKDNLSTKDDLVSILDIIKEIRATYS